MKPSESKRDLARGRTAWLVFGVPALAILISGWLNLAIPVVWPLAQIWMGGACLLNARRCGRVHCYLTGPFFLIMAAASLAHGLQVVPLGSRGWDWLGWLTLGGGLALSCIAEHMSGRYRQKEAAAR